MQNNQCYRSALNRRFIQISIVLSVCGIPMTAHAAICTSGNAAQQIACLKMANGVLTERIEQQKLMKNLDGNIPKAVVHRQIGYPSVVSTYGIGNHMTAVLVWMKHGKDVGRMITHDGSAIPGGWYVQSITGGNVVIRHGTVTKTLLLSNGQASQPLLIPSTTGVNYPVPTVSTAQPATTLPPVSSLVSAKGAK